MSRMASEKIAAFVDHEMQLELTDKQHRSFVKNLDHPVRKLAHMAEFGAVGFVLFWIVGCYVKRGRFLVCIGILALLGTLDELHQLMIVARECKWQDVVVDTVGGGIGVMVGALVLGVWRGWRNEM